MKKDIFTSLVAGLMATTMSIDVSAMMTQSPIDIQYAGQISNYEFLDASRRGDLVTVQNFIQQNGDVNSAVDERGRTALMITAITGNKEIMDILVQNGAEINYSKEGVTAIILAALAGHKDIVEYLLTQPETSTVFEDGHNVLMAAVLSKNIELIKFLIERDKSQINAATQCGTTALMYAAEEGNIAAFKLLLDEGADVAALRDGISALELAIRSHKAQDAIESIIHELCIRRVDINRLFSVHPMFDTALKCAIAADNINAVNALINEELNINYIGPNSEQTPLGQAVSSNRKEIAKVLIRCGARLSDEETRDLDLDEEMSKIMRDTHPITDEGFAQAVRVNDHKTVRDYMRFRDENECTNLLLASQKGKIDIVKLLLENGADINACSKNGFTALMLATCAEHKDIVEFLSSKGASIDAANNGQYTALMCAAGLANTEIAQILIQYGANKSLKNDEGKTAYDIALLDEDMLDLEARKTAIELDSLRLASLAPEVREQLEQYDQKKKEYEILLDLLRPDPENAN